MKLFTKEIDTKLFEQYLIGSDLENQMVVAKIFNPYGRGTWYLLNSDPEDPEYLWAIVDMDDIEVGSVNRSDLENIRIKPFMLGLERDLSFRQMNALELYEGLNEGKKYLKGGSVEAENKEMVLNNNKQIAHHTKEISAAVKNAKNVPAWVVAKVNRSATDLSDATHYMEGQGKSYADGGGVFKDGGGVDDKIYFVVAETKGNLGEYVFNDYFHETEAEAIDVMNRIIESKSIISKNLPKDVLFDTIKIMSRPSSFRNLYADGGGVGQLRLIVGHRYILNRYNELSRGEFVPSDLKQYWNVWLDEIINNEYVKVSGFLDDRYFKMVVKKSSLLPYKQYADGGAVEWDKDSDSIRTELGEFRVRITPQMQKGYYDVYVSANKKEIGKKYDVYGIANAKDIALEIISNSNKFDKGGMTKGWKHKKK